MMPAVHAVAYCLVFLLMLTSVGNWATRLLFWLTRRNESAVTETRKAHPAGWVIGGLERMIIAVGILTHSWEVLAVVIALKTVARFKELDDQAFAEYFLIGSLFSVLWAVVVTSVWLAYDANLGLALHARLTDLIAVPDQP
jgi:hypothetical protein